MSLVSVLFNPLRATVYTAFGASMRRALKFDSVGVRGQLAQRAINPDGNIDIEFTRNSSTDSGFLLSQNISSTLSGREFSIFLNTSGIFYLVGGVETNISSSSLGLGASYPVGRYRLKLVANSLQVYFNGNLLSTITITRGAAREPSAVTVIGARTNGAVGTLSTYYSGVIRDLKINGTRWPMADRNQSIQLPEPSGLGTELLVNPSVASDGTGWGKNNITVQSLSSNSFKLTNSINSYAGAIFQTVPTVIGEKYAIRFKLGFQTANTNFRVSVNSTTAAQYTGDLLAANYTASEQYLFVIFTATTTSATIRLLCNSSTAGSYVEVSELTLKPLGTCNPMTISNATSANWMQVADDYDPKFRKVLRFDGIGVRGVFASEIALNGNWEVKVFINPVDTGFTQGILGKELFFKIQVRTSGVIQALVGDGSSWAVILNSQSAVAFDGKRKLVRVLKSGNTYSLFIDGVSGESIVSGASLLPAISHLGVRSTLTSTSYARGLIYDIDINGVKYPLADANQTIQLPEPSGLGTELITQSVLENPAIKGSQWTYLGDGRWQYIGDGTSNGLRFLAGGGHPAQGFLEFEIESISSGGQLNSTGNGVARGVFNSVGVKRLFYTNLSEISVVQFTRFGTSIFSCIIKNISLKPLGTCNPITLANVTSANWEDLEI